jgi:hypothetical protein
MSPKLEKLWMSKFDGKKTLRLDWDNDRHHEVVIEAHASADEVRSALLQMAVMIDNDIHLRV